MDRILEYRVKPSDLDKTVGGIVVKVLKHCMGLRAHEISHAKFTPGGISVLRNDNSTGEFEFVTVKDRISAGDIVRVLFSDDIEKDEERVLAVKGDIQILYEDEDVIVLNKPAGIVSHPSHGHYRDSLANYLAEYYETSGKPGRLRTVGRLDKDTSGTILFAKNAPAASRLFRQKDTGLFRKTYLAIADNLPEEHIRFVFTWHLQAILLLEIRCMETLQMERKGQTGLCFTPGKCLLNNLLARKLSR